jgi:hypothetical protein
VHLAGGSRIARQAGGVPFRPHAEKGLSLPLLSVELKNAWIASGWHGKHRLEVSFYGYIDRVCQRLERILSYIPAADGIWP